jgi:RNA polymerase sigma-70 factor (ECF subfamily)
VGQLSRASASEQPFDEVVDAARLGAAWAYRVLYETFAGRVCAYLATHSASDPEDLTSEVFLRAFDGLPRFQGGEPQFRAWLFTIAYHLLVDDARREHARPQLTNSLDARDDIAGGDAEEDALSLLGDDWVRRHLDDLPVDQRNVLVLRIIGDLTVDQVAGVLGKRPGAVKQLQRRGLAALRRRLEGASR